MLLLHNNKQIIAINGNNETPKNLSIWENHYIFMLLYVCVYRDIDKDIYIYYIYINLQFSLSMVSL